MSRLLVPEVFTQEITLLNNINDKDIADGSGSVLIPYKTAQGIDLPADVLVGDDAVTHDNNRLLFSKNAENFRQIRDNKFEPVTQRLKGGGQFLKALYKPNYKAVAAFGFNIDKGGKIDYPTDFAAKNKLFNDYKTKSDSFIAPAVSPLQIYLDETGVTLAADKITADAADASNTNFLAQQKDSENETQLRNKIFAPVLIHINGIGEFLKKLYPTNTKKLGKWGFVVVDAKQKPVERTIKLKLSDKKTVHGITIGGVAKNIGAGDLHYYKGKTTTGTPTIVHAGESFGVVKGYSVITFVNPSSLIDASIKVLKSK
jgi:hypothetical protein